MTAAATNWQLSPAMWNIGAAEMITDCAGAVGMGAPRSASVIAAAAPLSLDARRKWMLFGCVSITPLGRPVVPLVKRMTNGSSSSSTASGKTASGAYVSSAGKSSSNESTVTSSGSDTPSIRSRRRWSPSSSLGSVSSTAYAISSPVHQPLSPTTTPPSATVAQNVTAYSTVLGATIATRSPGPMPYLSRNAAATAA